MSIPEGFVRLSVNISKSEAQALKDMATEENRNKTELIREWLRSLPTYQKPSIKKP
jgi:hypothetical protein